MIIKVIIIPYPDTFCQEFTYDLTGTAPLLYEQIGVFRIYAGIRYRDRIILDVITPQIECPHDITESGNYKEVCPVFPDLFPYLPDLIFTSPSCKVRRKPVNRSASSYRAAGPDLLRKIDVRDRATGFQTHLFKFTVRCSRYEFKIGTYVKPL